jgi:hypothetical protein
MTRHEDWPIRLNAAIDAARDRPFEWGTHDCALFAFNIVRDLTGIDYASAYRGNYHTAQGAARALRKQGKGTLRATVGGVLGTEVPPPTARRGDLLLWCQPKRGDTIGVCIDDRGAFVGPAGLVFVPVKDCEAAWHV